MPKHVNGEVDYIKLRANDDDRRQVSDIRSYLRSIGIVNPSASAAIRYALNSTSERVRQTDGSAAQAGARPNFARFLIYLSDQK